jgi:hypothetical protein
MLFSGGKKTFEASEGAMSEMRLRMVEVEYMLG